MKEKRDSGDQETGDSSQQAVVSDPVHEEAQGLLMRLLVQAGRRHLALRHYQALRAALQRELEVEPDASLQGLYQDIQGSHPVQGSRSTLIRIVKEPA